MPTQDYHQLTTCFYVVEDGPDDLARPLHVTLDIAPTTAGWLRERTFAEYLRRVHETAQKGDYIPADYDIVRYKVPNPERLPDIRAVNNLRGDSFTDEIRMAGGDATHIINLRALEYLFDNHEEPYLEQYIATGIIGRLCDDQHTREMLKYQRVIDHQEHKALSAIETAKGVLLFSRDGWGKECRQAYLQYLADNYFTPQGREFGYVREYLIEHPTEELRASYRMQPHAFSLYDYAFMPHKAQYQDRSLFEDQMALRSHPVQQDYDTFHSFVNMFRLTTNVHNVQVMRLLYMRALGNIPQRHENRRIPLLSQPDFQPLLDRLDALSKDSRASRQDIYAVQRQIRDRAAEILEKHYHLPPSQVYNLRKEQRKESLKRKPFSKIHL
ncbi:MAG: hypothetical protein DBY24_09490 [Prevotellaceae bacterium]|nr:MAG: hypothetical protein DBY24_09490 [Prevotellaceae bacterium]